MDKERLKYLLDQYVKETSTPEETKELFSCIEKLNKNAVLEETVKELWYAKESVEQEPETTWINIQSSISESTLGLYKKLWWRVAAAVVVVFGVSIFFLLNRVNSEEDMIADEVSPLMKEIIPGGNKALLTLSNGEQIILEESADGMLAEQGNTKIIKLGNGQLSYTNSRPSNEVLFNTISTPRGGQYQIVLADGTKIWLNAASSLHFPVSFSGDTREVKLTGEGYFEVAHNKRAPFLVSANGLEVEVLGTHFNVNAYGDEVVTKTTLLEGSVSVKNGQAAKIIKPGEQAETGVSKKIEVQKVDVDAVTAWKNGRFIFPGDNIQSVMRQLSRWYNADVSYEDGVTNEQFIGVINRSRYDKITDILEMLEKTGTVSFSVEGNNIKVKPYQE